MKDAARNPHSQWDSRRYHGPIFDAKSGMNWLILMRKSTDIATQSAGRRAIVENCQGLIKEIEELRRPCGRCIAIKNHGVCPIVVARRRAEPTVTLKRASGNPVRGRPELGHT
jgi:hypothetical protein